MSGVVTLTTDFGTASPYVAAMKGALLSVNPRARIVDLSHAIPPQDVRHASYFLTCCVPYFPAGTIHVCVVDPGVGTGRALLLAKAGEQFLLAPDNGCLTGVLERIGGTPTIRRLTERQYWRETVSDTFHGRDVLAPVAGHLSQGVDPAQFGPVATDCVRLETPQPNLGKKQIRGEVIFVDEFGNLLTNIPAAMVTRKPNKLRVSKRSSIRVAWLRSYAEAKPGSLVAVISSNGLLEIAVTNGNAAVKLKARVGTPVIVGLARS